MKEWVRKNSRKEDVELLGFLLWYKRTALFGEIERGKCEEESKRVVMLVVMNVKENGKALGVVRSKIVYMRAVNSGARSF